MNKHIRYPSTNQFRNIVKSVEKEYCYRQDPETEEWIRDPSIKKPVLEFLGTVKAHGTNSSIVIKPGGTQYAQSRNNVITPEADNAGFAQFASNTKVQEFVNKQYNTILEEDNIINTDTVTFYGEWCCGNIQKGVALSQIKEKHWIIFGIKVTPKDEDKPSWWLGFEWEFLTDKSLNIYDIDEFQTFEIEIDFENPQMSQNKLIELTEQVEKECPIGKGLGVDPEGCTTGEGIVWTHYKDNGSVYRFKVKGEKHSASKVKKAC